MIIPPILRLIQLRRTMSDSIMVRRDKCKIGAEIPLYQVTTVELTMSKHQAPVNRKIHRGFAGKLTGVGQDEDTGEGPFDR